MAQRPAPTRALNRILPVLLAAGALAFLGLSVLTFINSMGWGFDFAAYYTAAGEAGRQAFNDWIRNSGEFDGVIDFDAIARRPEAPRRLSPLVDGGDGLHPCANGYQILTGAIDLGLEPDPTALV